MKSKIKLLYAIIFLSTLPFIIFPILFIINDGFFTANDLLLLIGSWLGLMGFVFLFWQYVIGIKQISHFFSKDIMAINKVHQFLGTYGIILYFAHPTILFFDYLINKSVNLLNISFATKFDIEIMLGKLGLTLVLLLWASSKLIRAKIPYRYWKKIHLLSFLILPTIYIHADDIGVYLGDDIVKFYFRLIIVLYFLIFIYRILVQLGIFKKKYEVVNKTYITKDVIKIDLKPKGKAIVPDRGQFINFQINLLGEAHPFTVSHFEEDTKILSISAKESGKFSKNLTNLSLGQQVYLDGPYGVFTKEAYTSTKKLVMVAGGIGITPFLRLSEFIKENPNKFEEAILIYGNKTENDIAFKQLFEEVAASSNLKIINVLSNVENIPAGNFEKGFVTVDLIKKYLKGDAKSYDYFICGPAIMMQKVTADLIKNGVSEHNIYKEEFSW